MFPAIGLGMRAESVYRGPWRRHLAAVSCDRGTARFPCAAMEAARTAAINKRPTGPRDDRRSGDRQGSGHAARNL